MVFLIKNFEDAGVGKKANFMPLANMNLYI